MISFLIQHEGEGAGCRKKRNRIFVTCYLHSSSAYCLNVKVEQRVLIYGAQEGTCVKCRSSFLLSVGLCVCVCVSGCFAVCIQM